MLVGVLVSEEAATFRRRCCLRSEQCEEDAVARGGGDGEGVLLWKMGVM